MACIKARCCSGDQTVGSGVVSKPCPRGGAVSCGRSTELDDAWGADTTRVERGVGVIEGEGEAEMRFGGVGMEVSSPTKDLSPVDKLGRGGSRKHRNLGCLIFTKAS